jgi:hypothetical protein
MDPGIITNLVLGLGTGAVSNLASHYLKSFAQRAGETISRRYSLYRAQVLKDLLEVIDSGQYPSFLQAESRHEITFGAVLLAGGAVLARLEPVVGIKTDTEYIEIATFAVGFYLAIQSTLKLRRMYPRRVRAKRLAIADELQKLQSKLSST